MNLIEILNNNKLNLDILKEHVFKDIKKTECDINVVIGVRQRLHYLLTVIKYFKKAIEKTNLKIALTIVEQDFKQELYEHLKNFRCFRQV